jgi:hypothetical protein
MNVGIAISILIKMPSKGGFPFSGKSRAIDFLRSLSFQKRAVNLIRCASLLVFQKKVVAKSRPRDFFH